LILWLVHFATRYDLKSLRSFRSCAVAHELLKYFRPYEVFRKEYMEPTTIALLVTSVSTLLLNIFQSVRSRHFEAKSGCCEVTYDSKHGPNDEKKDEKS
jgi:hypothetical protein